MKSQRRFIAPSSLLLSISETGMIFSCDIRKEGYENVNRISGFDGLLCWNQDVKKYFMFLRIKLIIWCVWEVPRYFSKITYLEIWCKYCRHRKIIKSVRSTRFVFLVSYKLTFSLNQPCHLLLFLLSLFSFLLSSKHLSIVFTTTVLHFAAVVVVWWSKDYGQ